MGEQGTPKYIGIELRRLRCLPYMPDDVTEHVRALWTVAMTADHARRITDALLDSCKAFPTPAEIRQAADRVSEDVRFETRPLCSDPGCPCGGTGFVSVERGGAWFASPCARGKTCA